MCGREGGREGGNLKGKVAGRKVHAHAARTNRARIRQQVQAGASVQQGAGRWEAKGAPAH